jgi:nitroreductase
MKGSNFMGNPVLTAISDRRSIRGYKPEQITKEQLDTLLRTAQEAPSANNSQEWHFSVVQNSRAFLDEINTEASKQLGKDLGDIFYGAPTVIFISAEADDRWARLDSGIAVQNMTLAAHSLGLGSVILGLPEYAFRGPKRADFDKFLKFPPKYSFAVAIAVGYPAATKEAHPIEPGRIDFIS